MANHPMLSPFKSPVQSLHWSPNGMVEMKTNPTNKRPKHIFRRVTITTPPPHKQQCHNLAAASTLDTVLHPPTLKPLRSFQALTSFGEIQQCQTSKSAHNQHPEHLQPLYTRSSPPQISQALTITHSWLFHLQQISVQSVN